MRNIGATIGDGYALQMKERAGDYWEIRITGPEPLVVHNCFPTEQAAREFAETIARWYLHKHRVPEYIHWTNAA